MKLEVAFALLAVFAAAQAVKKTDVLSWGTGYSNKYQTGGDLTEETGDSQDNAGSASAVLVGSSTRISEAAKDEYSTKSEALGHSARSNEELAEQKKALAEDYHNRARNQATKANEAYKNSQLHKRHAQDKQAIAKQYEQRAQVHDRMSKEQDMAEMDLHRKAAAERDEANKDQASANAAATNARLYQEDAEAELAYSSEWESLAKDLYGRAEQYEKEALELRDKAKKEKEVAKAQEAKAKEEEARAQEYENAFFQNSKKLDDMKYYQLEFLVKAQNERHQAEDARIRAKYYSLLAQLNKAHANFLHLFAQNQLEDSQLYHKRSVEAEKEKKIFTRSVEHLLKRHSNYVGHSVYNKNFEYREKQ